MFGQEVGGGGEDLFVTLVVFGGTGVEEWWFTFGREDSIDILWWRPTYYALPPHPIKCILESKTHKLERFERLHHLPHILRPIPHLNPRNSE
jgi:hypothetical protein